MITAACIGLLVLVLGVAAWVLLRLTRPKPDPAPRPTYNVDDLFARLDELWDARGHRTSPDAGPLLGGPGGAKTPLSVGSVSGEPANRPETVEFPQPVGEYPDVQACDICPSTPPPRYLAEHALYQQLQREFHQSHTK